MAEFERDDLFSDDFMAAPQKVKDDIVELLAACDKLVTVGTKLDKSFGSAKTITELSKNVTTLAQAEKGLADAQKQVVFINEKLTTQTKNLTLEEVELAKITKTTEVAVARQSKAYQEQKKQLDQVNKTTKEKNVLGDKEAATVNATNASIKQLSAALAKNRSDYEALTNAEKRNSKEGQDLLATIQSQDKELKQLKKSLGQNQLEVGNYEGALANLKEEMKGAKDELAGIAATLGTSSPEYVAAAQRAGELKDQLNDVQEAVADLSGGSGFERAGAQSKRFMDQFKAGDLKGATGTLKGLATTLQGLTFKESIAGAGGFLKALGSIGKAILTNPLFLLAAAVVGIGVAVNALKDKIPFLTKAFDAVGEAIDWVVQKGKEFSDWALGSTFIADDKAQAIADAAQKEVDAIRERYDDEIAIAEAAGKDVVELERKKQEAILAEATKGIVALSKIQNQSDEQKEQYQAFLTIVKNANRDIQIEEGKHQVELQKARDEAEKERQKKEEEAWNERKKRLAEEAAAFKLGLKDQRDAAARDFGKIGDEINKGIKGRAEAFLKGATKTTADFLRQMGFTIQSGLETVADRWVGALSKIQEQLNAWGNAVGDLFAALTASKLQDLDQEQKQSEIKNKELIKQEKDRLATQLEDETLTEEQRDQLKVQSDKRTRALEEANEKRQIAFEQRRKAALRKQAIYEKALALSQAIIAGALAVAKALPAIPLALAAGALAALQVAAIAARPIPAAEHGVKNFEGGWIRAGEKGDELVRIPGRQPMLTSGDGLYNVPRGTTIENADDTVRWLAMQALASTEFDRTEQKNSRVEYEIQQLTKAVKSNGRPIIAGKLIGFKQKGTRMKYINSLRNIE